MSWRLDIKTYFADLIAEALGNDLFKFGPWNSQKINTDTEETLPPLSCFFEYSSIGDGLEYLLQTNIRQAERVPVQVTLHLVFNSYTEEYQDLAYDYAEKITQYISGRKHECISGRILKIGELEDANHAAQYDYQISFAFFIKEAAFKIGDEIEVDANPEDGTNPDTGRKILADIRINP